MDTARHESTPEGNEDQSPEIVKAHAWEREYEQALDEVFKDPEHVLLDDIVEVAFQKGIVERLAPLDEEIKRLRIEQRRRVWEGDREDAEFYARLFYAIEFSKEMFDKSVDLSWTNMANAAYNRIMRSNVLQERFFGNSSDAKSSAMQFSDALQKRILKEYGKKGGTLDLKVIPEGAKVVFHGIELKVLGYNPDGTLRVDTEGEEGHRELWKYNKGKITPEMFLSEDFVIQQ